MIVVPEAFKSFKQFILWKPVPLPDGKVSKKPVSPFDLTVHDPHDQEVWVDYQTGAMLADQCNLGLGFVFTTADPFWFLDIDNAWNGSEWSPLSTQLCEAFSGCAVEVSQSGTGLHVFGSGQVPSHGCKNIQHGLELYTELRFVALTGTNLAGDATVNASNLQWLVDAYFPATNPNQSEPVEWTTGPCPEWSGPTDDNELLGKMLRTQSAGSILGNKASVADLWNANVDVLAGAYPSVSGTHGYDQSSADAALCSHLAFWTGKDAERMDRLFRTSALVRDKWVDREDYRQRTVLGAIGHCQDVYGSHRDVPQMTPDLAATMNPDTPPAGAPVDGMKVGYQFLSANQQMEHFKDCIYIRDLHRVLTPDGSLLKPDQFKVMFGGHDFAMDNMNAVKPVKDAFQVFTVSQAIDFPKAHAACFRPELPPLEIIEEEDMILANTYIPIKVARKQGDPGRFLDLINKLIPDATDQQTILSYMAACVQMPGKKFQWTPLIQGMQGNGKTLLGTCVAAAIGWRYSHTPNASDLGNKFNAWVVGKLFCIVEEIWVRDKAEVMEALKPLITNLKIEIQGKGDNQKLGDNRANFMMFTNHKDAIRIAKGDRRYAVFYTAQQTMQDLANSGMTGEYFTSLWDWFRMEGFAIVAEYLNNYPISKEFKIQLMYRAPKTSNTSEALRLSLGGLEQEILEAAEEGRYGFSGGWISSLQLNQLLRERRDEKRIPPNKRRAILDDLGYMPHAHLKGGRVNNIILKEAGKPVLYIKKDHPALVLRATADIQKAYLNDQEAAGN
ncbi:MAG: hypothetical protein KAJ10_03715 [Thermodesulfovibrionia bacterium]|nr:hypothetical protein [Thermodesulfovibrionia bacterium]